MFQGKVKFIQTPKCVYREKGLGFYPAVEVEFCPFRERKSVQISGSLPLSVS